MKAFLKCILFFPWILSCAEKLDFQPEGDETVIYQSGGEKDQYLSCNRFADETFRGYVWTDSKSSTNTETCITLEITKSPGNLLKNEDLFLQVYPFLIEGEETEYGSSVAIKTIKKEEGGGVTVVRSQIIDTYLVETELNLDPDYFFIDHFFELCGIEKKWDGIQIVVYKRRANQEKPAPVRITKFLLPPFLVHPEYFREAKGNALAAFHPFLRNISDFKSKPSAYYDLAERMCRYTPL